MDAAASSSSKESEINPDSSLFEAHQYLFDVALYIDEAHHASTNIFAIIGVVFNLLLMAVIASSKELHHRRILIWLGIGISNLFVLSSHVLISQSVVWGSSSSERSLCYWYVILSIGVQMFNVIYTALERYICINYPGLHKKAVFSAITITLVPLTSYMPLFIVLGMLNLSNFQEQSQPVAFEYSYFQLVGSFFFGWLFFFPCGHMALTKTKRNQEERSIETGNQQPNIKNQKSTHQMTTKTSMAVRIGNNEISQLDFRSAQHFYFLVKVHFIFMALKLITFIRIFICLTSKQGLSSEKQVPMLEAECSSVIKAFYFIGAFLDCFYSSIANPAAFLFFTLIKDGRPINAEC